MSEKTYPDKEGYDPTVGMDDEEIQRFEYILWFEGDWIPPRDIADAISDFIISRGGAPLHAGCGTIHVPREDVGEDPHLQEELVRVEPLNPHTDEDNTPKHDDYDLYYKKKYHGLQGKANNDV